MNWYLLQTKPKQEQRVENHLKSGNLTCYSPKVRRTASRKNEPVIISEPLFPGYIFVRTSLEENYRKINYTRGVVGFVNFGKGPVLVNEKIIGKIRCMELDGFVLLNGKRELFKKGERKRQRKRNTVKELGAIFHEPMSPGERISLLLKAVY